MWFWIFAILTPIINFILGYFVFMPIGKVAQNKFIVALSIATGIAFVLYILLGFIISKMFKNRKLGDWC
jgi:methionine sulfoxide reductase heme-binding subunit